MSPDQQTYRRAATAALLGLAVQVVFTVIMAVLGLYARSTAISAATWHLLGGVAIWLTLWLLYTQHRKVRDEALEAEELSRTDARAAALFDEAGHELASAKKGLDRFYRWGLSAVSGALALYLIAVGGAMLWAGYTRIERTPGEATVWTRLFDAAFRNGDANAWMLVGLCALMAFGGFLVARYVAGMTRLRDWSLLRGGAGYLIGNVVIIILVGLAAGAQAAGVLWPFAALSLLIPAVMVILGVEMALALIFGAYRPRREGEIVRPAFDSRLLGWLTRPESLGKIVSETLNYQFGFEITKSWFYVLLARAITPLVVIGVLMLIALTSVVIVAPHQQAVITDRGRLVRIAGPGLSFKLPWPLGSVEKYDVGRSQQMVIGTYAAEQRIAGKATLWTNEHVTGEVTYLATAPTRLNDRVLRQRIEEEVGDGELDDPNDTDPRNDSPANDGAAGVNTSADSAATDAPPRRTSTSSLGGLIALQCVVTYNIGDLARYVATDAADRPEKLLRALAEQHLSAVVATREVDSLIGPGRLDTGDELLRLIRADAEPLGFAITDVLLYDIHPPNEGEVADAYLQQVNALQTQKTAVENARKDAIATLSTAAGSRSEALRIADAIAELERLKGEAAAADAVSHQQREVYRLIDLAGGEAAQTLARAREQRWRIALDERAEGTRFAFELEAFNKAPEYFKARYYLDTLAEAFNNASRRIITTVDTNQPGTVRLNLEDASAADDLFSN